jgi:hypothetical protein
MKRNHSYQMTYDVETSLGEARCLIDFTICPEEPMVMYYRDGSGYPGSPAYIESFAVRLLSLDDTPPKSLPALLREQAEREAYTVVDRDTENDGPISHAMWEAATPEPEPCDRDDA